MIKYLLFLLSFSAYAHSGCPPYELQVPDAQRVALAPIEGAALPEEPEIIHLSYRFEVCAGGQTEIHLVENHANGEFKSSTVAFKGKIDKFYVPRNAVEEFEPLSSFAKLVRSDYRMITGARTTAELRFYSGGRLYSLSARRGSDSKFAPFEPLVISARVPPNAGVQLVAYPKLFRVDEFEFALWTLETSDGYRMTSLIDIGNARDLKLIADFVIDDKGGFLLDPPKVEDRILKFDNLGRWVKVDNLHAEMMFSPMSKVLWQKLLSKSKPTRGRSLSATFGTPPDSPKAADQRQFFAGPIDRSEQFNEWLAMLASKDLASLVSNRAQLRAQGIEAFAGLLKDEVPLLASLRDEVSVGAVEAASESAVELLLTGALDLVRLRKVVRGHLVNNGRASEDRCQRALAHILRANDHVDLSLAESQNLRKLSFNLDVLKRRLLKAGAGGTSRAGAGK